MARGNPFERRNPNEVVSGVGFTEDIGLRGTMEDRHVIEGELGGNKERKLFAIYDGHGGIDGADIAAEKLHKYFIEELSVGLKPKEAIKRAFFRVDAEIEERERELRDNFGTTAVVAFFEKDQLLVANAGDARGILVRKDTVGRLTRDHKPDDPEERRRIVGAGGTVQKVGVWRVNGNIAVSRALGDGRYGDLVSAEPDIRELKIAIDDKRLVLACDGIWDVITDEDAARLIANESDPQRASRLLKDEALRRGSRDNLSVMVINLNG